MLLLLKLLNYTELLQGRWLIVAVLHNDLEDLSSNGFSLNIGNFEGPFDLLLSLISKHQVDITSISLSQVTNDFIAYVRTLEDADQLEEASEFLVVAATLLDIKIAELLPKGEVVDAEDVALLEARDLLFARLLQYRAFKDISSWFQTAIALESRRVYRSVRLDDRFRTQRPELVWTVSLEDFARLAEETMAPREIPMVGLTHLHAPRISIREQAAEVVALLRAATTLTFRELISSVRDRAVLVARFLAILELYRMSAVSFEQSESLGPLQITWRAEDFDDEQLSALGADYES
ncbi:MAG: segregation/condensation protein A [Rhodoluna sp.]|jgi:segregation and condensation protein A|nr:segregation/condensation protein A [Rhodoluna sp.]